MQDFPARAVVVAELFTSEGCSSCPPADTVLSRLGTAPLGGVTVLGLGEHVDYWDNLGWRDPFSAAAFSTRQASYQGVLRTPSTYTPQIVIDGQFEAVGSDVVAVRRVIERAAHVPKAIIDISAHPAEGGQLSVTVRTRVPETVVLRERADVVIAVTQDRLTTQVRHGENRRRTLTHSAVVRSLTDVGGIEPGDQLVFEKIVTVPLAADWDTQNIRIIGLLQSSAAVGSSAPDRHLSGSNSSTHAKGAHV